VTGTGAREPYVLVATVDIDDGTPLMDSLREAGLRPEAQERGTFPLKGIDRLDVYVVESEVAEAMRLIAAAGYR
jgi:hypothetical protein